MSSLSANLTIAMPHVQVTIRWNSKLEAGILYTSFWVSNALPAMALHLASMQHNMQHNVAGATQYSHKPACVQVQDGCYWPLFLLCGCTYCSATPTRAFELRLCG